MNRGERRVGRLPCVALGLTVLAGLLLLGVRLFDVQVNDSADYADASARQSVRRVRISGLRGRILDRHGTVLADNRQQLTIVCKVAELQRRTWEATIGEVEQAIARLSEVLGVASPLTRAKVARHVRQELALPLEVWKNVGDDVLARFVEHQQDFPQFELQQAEQRSYPLKSLAAQTIGWATPVRQDGAEFRRRYHFVRPELRGKGGLESYYDGFLRGVAGEQEILVDARGFETQSRVVVEPQRGLDLRLTLDVGIQRVAEAQLEGFEGACVVIDPRNGDILAMASAPGYDLNTIRQSDVYAALSEDPRKPRNHRALGERYAPGSVFKPIVALAGLTLGYPPEHPFDCMGFFGFGSMSLKCTARWGHGEIDLRQALMKSCNPYFCNLGVDIGSNAVIRAARDFRLGARTGVDFGIDDPGVVPDGAYKESVCHEQWQTGDLAQLSIGQGLLSVTPMQMACVAGALGTGYLVTPHFKAGLPTVRTPLPFSREHLEIVRDGLRMVVAGDGASRGTGWRAGVGLPVAISGKTGTAEVGMRPKLRKNAWFIAYAPAENPTVALALVIENGESGGSTAAPRAREVLREALHVH